MLGPIDLHRVVPQPEQGLVAVLRFALRQLRFRRARALALGAGVLVASMSFALLTAAATTSELRVQGTVAESFRGAYDILVRPPAAVTDLEVEQGLVAANFLSGTFGGITRAQYESILDVPGVEVAAPLANIGYVLPSLALVLPVPVDEGGAGSQLFRVRQRWVTDAGVSRIEGGADYVYVSTVNEMVEAEGEVAREVVPGEANPLPVCETFNSQASAAIGFAGPFATGPPQLSCFSTRSPGVGHVFAAGDELGAVTSFQPPVLLAAIDPDQEAALLALDDTIVQGRYLQSGEEVSLEPLVGDAGLDAQLLPLIASTETFVDTTLEVSVERLDITPSVNVPRLLTGGTTYQTLIGLDGEVVDEYEVTTNTAYEQVLERLTEQPSFRDTVQAYWRPGSVTYTVESAQPLRAEALPPDEAAWSLAAYPDGLRAPPGNGDVGVRPLSHFAGAPIARADIYQLPVPRVVGRYDPNLLPGFNELSEVPLDSYYPPAVRAGDAASEAALGGAELRPTMNLSGYVAQPPLMLTTLDAAETLLRPEIYDGAEQDSYISSIRVRVAGVTGPDDVSRERIRRVAATIADVTGLTVDITAGSSPTAVTVALPAGNYGRPALTVEEDWVQKGVAVEVLTAVDRKSVALFVLVLLVCAFFVANAAMATVRARRTEIGTLRSLGWDRRKIFTTVLGELAIVGAGAGLLGAALAAGLVTALSLDFPLLLVALIPPVALLLTVCAGFWSALRASRLTPIDAFRAPVTRSRRARPVRSLPEFARANLLRLPGRTLLGSLGLAMAVAGLVVLLAINLAFEGLLAGTLLGDAVVVQTRTVDYISVGLAIALGGLSVADVLYLNLNERAAELATLRSSGWSQRQVVRAGILESLGLGILGAATGAVVGVLIAASIAGALSVPLVAVAVLCAAGGVSVALLASAVPLRMSSRSLVPRVLAEES